MYTGFHDTQALPIKQGQTVTIPKGTKVKSMHPQRGTYTTKREQTVKVNHLMNGQSISVGTVRADGDFRWSVNDRDLFYITEQLGLPYDTVTERNQSNDKIRDIAIQNKQPANDKGTLFVALVPTLNPTVVWPGTGGYWCEVDINDVIKAA